MEKKVLNSYHSNKEKNATFQQHYSDIRGTIKLTTPKTARAHSDSDQIGKILLNQWIP